MDLKICDKALSLISLASTAVLASIDDNGYPRAVPMASIKTEELHTMWFATGTNSEKVKHYRKNNKASVCYHAGDDTITFTGEVQMVDDMAIKKELWLDWFINHFPGGIEDPEYCILKFSAKQAVVWIDRVFEHITL